MGVGAPWRNAAIARLLSGQCPDGSFGVHPYSKWTGAHWRLVSLVELGVPRSNLAARAAARTVLDWIAAPSDRLVINRRERRHASMEGNAIAVCCRLGMALNPRVNYLVEVLLRAQWPDHGWNCDRNPDAQHSSFHETLAPIWGLIEYHRCTGDTHALEAARVAGELLLDHRLFMSRKSGRSIHPEWTHIHWPHYWHYDFFHGMRAIAELGWLDDPRTADAKELLARRRRRDGTWGATGRRYWTRSTDVVDWGDADQIITPVAKALLQ